MKHIGLVRTGLWSITWQMTWLAGGVLWFFCYYGRGYPSTNLMPAAGLAAAVAFSRIGLWGFDLSAQNIVQDVCPPPRLFLSRVSSLTPTRDPRIRRRPVIYTLGLSLIHI